MELRFIPMGVDIFKLTRRYLKIRNKQTEIGYVALKKVKIDFSDFLPYISVVTIAIYLTMGFDRFVDTYYRYWCNCSTTLKKNTCIILHIGE